MNIIETSTTKKIYLSTKQIINNLIKNSIISINTDDWDEAREQIIHNLFNIEKFKKVIENYIPCKKNLYISKQQLEKQIKKYLFRLDKFFIKLSDETVIPRKDIDEEEIKEIISLGTNIIIHKQQDKYLYIEFTMCPCPSLPIDNKEIEKLEKFIKIEKYLCSEPFNGISINDLFEGLSLYKFFVHNSNKCLYDTFGQNGCYGHLYSLYKSNDGTIYFLDIWNLQYVISYAIIDNEKWFHLGI